ncbi:RNA polymerase, sigma-24 subunit, ECF subfamily [Syntrophobotulus glycolicus DSM 8271]|uniref:RNA polymerase, sigma-24 subunit, ECF subfamily n=1 Tax=Syntrophobotulus glycolicus (strain DSM 8271 / FlGlyR) TaxID=645991 RepID=F0SXW6_SYNGF|nr:sigma-70 family RNA polymerase sigma factor [Syntrophobotulus glycolicus]ADY57027.1 RNA polymerase, sigma-24 subunit, ECF subfamily [Syntrophobotulus glycolicus DSM 8271]
MLIIFAAIQNKEDRSRLEALYQEHVSLMYKVAKRILNDEHLAQDAVQEAFINILNHVDKIFNIDCNKIRVLFVIIVRNTAIDIYRQRKKQSGILTETPEEDLSDPGPSVEEILIRNEILTGVAEKMKKLYPPYADILSLKYSYQYTNEEISRLLNLTPENTRTRLHRARKSLNKLLAQEEGGTNRG